MEAPEALADRARARPPARGVAVDGRRRTGLRRAASAAGGLMRAAPGLAKPRRQARLDHLAQGAVVVGGAELQQREVALGERRHVVDHLRELPQAVVRDVGPRGPGDHHADLRGAPEGHDDEASAGRIEAFRHPEIEGLLEGDVEGDAGDFHGAAKAPFSGGPQPCG